MTGFRVRIECPDCTYVDPMGCNDGEPWYVCANPLDDPAVFATREEAEAAGEEHTRNSIYAFAVEPAGGDQS